MGSAIVEMDLRNNSSQKREEMNCMWEGLRINHRGTNLSNILKNEQEFARWIKQRYMAFQGD